MRLPRKPRYESREQWDQYMAEKWDALTDAYKNGSRTQAQGDTAAWEQLGDDVKQIVAEFPRVQWRWRIEKAATAFGGLDWRTILQLIQENSPTSEPVPSGIELSDELLKRPDALWGDFLCHGGTNLLISPPKTGKTALIVHLAGCLLRGDDHCLGVPLTQKLDHLFILGPDMATQQWTDYLAREGLFKDKKIDERVTVWAREQGQQLDQPGIDLMKSKFLELRENAGGHLNSFLLIDTYQASIRNSEIKEGDAAIARPLQDCAQAFASLSVTLLVNHHTRKSGGDSHTDKTRGSGSLTGAFDQTLSLERITPGSKVDRRLILDSEGRVGQGVSVCGEMVSGDDGLVTWVTYGDGEAVKARMRREEAEMGMSDYQEKVYDFVCTRFDNGHKTSLNDVTDAQPHNGGQGTTGKGDRTGKQYERTLRALTKKQLLEKLELPAPPGVGGRCRVFWQPHEDYMVSNDAVPPQTPPNPPTLTTPRAPARALHVEVFRADQWQGGWVTYADPDSQDRFKVEELGNPMKTISNCLWGSNVRLPLDVSPPLRKDGSSPSPGQNAEPQASPPDPSSSCPFGA